MSTCAAPDRDRIRSSLLALPLVAAAVACGVEPAVEPPSDATETRRVVVMAPAAAEMIEALGATDLVVGVGDFVPSPPAPPEAPHVGAYNAPSVERVLELRADLYVSTASEAAGSAHRRLATLGVVVLALDTSTYDGVFDSLSELGDALDRRAQAETVAMEMRQRIGAVRQAARGLPRRRVLFVVGRDPLFVAGPGSHADEMIETVGGINVAHDAPTPYHRASLETMLERMPEIIVDTSDNRPDAPRGRMPGDWGRWSFLPAVEQDRVYWVDPARLAIPGMRLPEMTELLARLVQPEAFGEPDPTDLVGE